MHSSALVTRWHMGQKVRGLNLENAEDIHDGIVHVRQRAGKETARYIAGRPGVKTGGAELLAVAERLVRGLAATAEAGLHGQELLAFAIVNPHEAAQFQRSVFNAGDGQGLRPIDLHTIGGLLKRPCLLYTPDAADE